MRVLTVNAGSTSIEGRRSSPTARRGIASTRSTTRSRGPPPDAVAHRVVHGGDRTGAAVVDDDVVDELARADRARTAAPAARARRASTAAARAWPDGAATSRASTPPSTRRSRPAARTYALPARLREQVRVVRLPRSLARVGGADASPSSHPTRGGVVVAHLGGGQSLCAVLDGRSVMTTMGFTPLDGLVMATAVRRARPRRGALAGGARADEDSATCWSSESGLLGLCGTARHARGARRGRATATPTRGSRSTSGATAPSRSSAAASRRSEGSTRSCSPAASASTSPWRVRTSRAASAGSASRSTTAVPLRAGGRLGDHRARRGGPHARRPGARGPPARRGGDHAPGPLRG